MNVAIVGYGNLGRGVEAALTQTSDMKAVGIFTRRDPKTITPATDLPVYALGEIDAHADEIDVAILCGGSATDLPTMTPSFAERFNVVDSFDTHARIPEHFAAVDAAARRGGHTALISGGWDPGLFSLCRLYASSVLPKGSDCTFWGRGVSQGHSDAIRRIPGVLDARQYTVPIPEAMDSARHGEAGHLTARQKHLRECYVVAEPGADLGKIEQAIKTMPNYFSDYDTTVTFITQEELNRDHARLPHGGTVIRTGTTGLTGENRQTIEFTLTLDSNPEFTSGVLVALARAVGRMNARGDLGCKTVFDVAPADLSALSPEELRAHLL